MACSQFQVLLLLQFSLMLKLIYHRMQTQIKKRRGGTGWGFLVLIQARMVAKVCLRKRIGREGLFGRSCSLQPACKSNSFIYSSKNITNQCPLLIIKLVRHHKVKTVNKTSLVTSTTEHDSTNFDDIQRCYIPQ